jgi:glycosyltransferase involved in cell wall biosynthesis
MNWAERLGGSEHALWSFLRHLDRDVLEPVVLFHGHGPFVDEVAGLGLRTLAIPAGRLRQLSRTAGNVARVARILTRERPDLVLAWLTKAQLYAGPAALLTGMAGRSAWLQNDFPDGRLADRMATLVPAAGIIACSNAVAAEQHRLSPRRRTIVVHPGVEPLATVSAEERRAGRARLGVPSGATVLGILGRLLPWKGQDRFLEALALLRGDGLHVHGLVIGGDAHGLAPEYGELLKRRTRELGLEPHVTFTGQVQSGADQLQLLDVVVSASAREPFGIVLVEAMAAGVPVVAVDAAGPREIVEHGTTGLLARTGEPSELSAALAPLVLDPALRSQLGARGRARYEERFTAERMARDLERAIFELLAARPGERGQRAARPHRPRHGARG